MIIANVEIRALLLALGLSVTSSIGATGMAPFEWTDSLRPGLSKSELTEILDGMGIEYSEGGGGLTYTAKFLTNKRDYLFCNDELIAMIEGEYAYGQKFNSWFAEFLSLHERHGEPNDYAAMPEFGVFKAQWVMEDGSTLHYELRSVGAERHIWTRQLYASEIGEPCE